MRRLAVLTAVLLVAAGSPSAAKRVSVLAVTHGSQGMSTLAWVDPLTLEPVLDGTVLRGRVVWPAARSPGGRYLLAVQGGAFRTLLRVVDLHRGGASPTLTIGGATGAFVVWPKPDRMIVVTIQNGRADQRLILAPHPLRVVARAPLAGTVVAAKRAGRSMVALLGPRGGIGPLRLLVIDAKGAVRTTELEGMAGGWEGHNTADGYVSRHAGPGLAVAPGARRVAVVGIARHAVVDLAGFRTTVRALAGRRIQKRGKGWWRDAVWLVRDRIAVTGVDYGGAAGEPSPGGLKIIDVGTGQIRTIDPTASYAAVRGRSMLFAWGRGLACFDLDGALRYHVDDASIGDVAFAYGHVYVNDSRDRTRFRVLDARTGRLLGRPTTESPTTVVGPI
jgi:hypothetical protein